MALDDLQGIIKELQDMIEAHRDYLSGHETRTRQVLIDPLLRELGWDVSNPDIVQLEYKVRQQRADYALMVDGQPVAVIEAKPLESDLEDNEIMQVLNYANRANIGYMIVTNGDRWEMYEVFQRGALEERLLMKLELSQQPAHQNALQALVMWRPNLASDSGPSEATEPALISPESALDRPSGEPDEPSKQQPLSISLEDSDTYCTLERKLYPQDTKPTKLKIEGRPEETVKNWQDTIHKVVAWLADEAILSVSDAPIGTETYTFIGHEAVNPNGTPFTNPQQLSNGLILQRNHANVTTKSQWRKLRQLLWDLKVNRNTIQVFYRPL